MGREGQDEGPDQDPAWLERVRGALADWYDRGHRDLPWRRETDPYRVLVSEMMLVQTTVAAVVPYYARFLARFPSVEALAEADESDVLKLWEGLGYYRRARQLQAAARAVVERHGGSFPEDLEAIRALPGVGRYIAGAVLSFAFDRRAPIVEANTQRVLSRLLAWPGELSASATQNRLWRAAERLVPEIGPGRFNQALMELGATVCTPKRPSCLVCPVASDCQARGTGLQDNLPRKAAREVPEAVVEACVLVRRSGDLLLVKRGPGRLWEGFWELPTLNRSGADPAGRSLGVEGMDLAEGVLRLSGVRVEVAPGPPRLSIRYGVTRYRVDLAAHDAADRGGDPAAGPGTGLVEARFVSSDERADLTLGAATRKLLARLGETDRERGA